MAVAIAVFAVALVLIASERVERTKVALLGAVILVLTQTIDQEQAIEAVDFNTIGLLAGMMVMVRLTENTGVYSWLAITTAHFSRGRSLLLVASLSFTTAVLSAFLDNVTTVLLVVPVTFMLADVFDIDPIPLVILEIIISNIGGTATLIGDPPNILIAGHTGLSFMAFIDNLTPIAALCCVAVTLGLYAVYRRRLQIDPRERDAVMKLDAGDTIEDFDEARRTVPILLATIILFFLHKPLHIEPATVALTGAAVMLLVTRQKVTDALASIEWPTLFFLMGLFVMVGALEEVGALGEVAHGIDQITGSRAADLLGIIWIAGLGGAVFDNIPFTAAMIPVVDTLAPPGDDAYWWALALGACFSGNALVISAAANIAASGIAAQHGHPVTFMTFLKVGIPVTIGTLILATGYVLLRYV
jgi:Na+/H+ antiporter NhaD/arsenite permease-like protein